jgi:hypothetical protein
MVQDGRSHAVIDIADYRCGYARPANDVFDSRLFTCMIRTTIIILQQIQIQPQQPKGEEGHQERELYRVLIFYLLKALLSEELGSRILKSGIVYI